MSGAFSYSRLDTLNQCAFRYYLRYELGHYVNTDSIATELGTAVHATEETIANTIKAGKSVDYIKLKNELILQTIDLEAKYTAAWQEVDKSNRTYFQKIMEYLESGIYRLEKFLLANNHIEIVDTEKEFEFTLPGTEYVFHGFIDRVLRNKNTGKYIIQDIKTYAVPLEKKKLKTPLQFVVYIHAAKELYGCEAEDVQCSYDLPFCNTTQEAGFGNFMEAGTNALVDLIKKIEVKEFAPSPSPLCHWCEYCPTNPNQPEAAKNLCPYYSLWTRENKTHTTASRWAGLDQHELVLLEYIACQNLPTNIVYYINDREGVVRHD